MNKSKTYSEWQSSLQGFDAMRHANCCRISYEVGQQSRQAEVDGFEKQLNQMKHINDEQNKNITNAFKTIEIQQKFDADSQGAIEHLTEMNQRYIGKMQEQQDQVADLKAQLTNMEQCYIRMKKERDELLDANTAMDRERNRYREQARVYQLRNNQAKSLIIQFFKLKQDKPEMTLMAVQNSLVGYGEP